MKQKTKILSTMLALLLTVGLVPSALMQASATEETENSYYEDYSTDDEPSYEPDYNVTSIEILKGPDCPEYTRGIYDEWPLYEGLEVRFTAKDGTTYDVTIDEEADLYQSIGGGEEDKFRIITGIDDALENLPLGENTITYYFGGCEATQTITVCEDPFVLNPVVSIELTKNPNKTFTEPIFDYCIGDDYNNIDTSKINPENSIAKNMEGAEIALIREDGSVINYTFDKPYAVSEYIAGYPFNDTSYGSIWVRDAGDYKIIIGLGSDGDAETEVSLLNTSSDPSTTQPTTTVTDETETNAPANTTESNSATADTPQGTSTNNSNGAVSTGMTVSMLIVMVLMTSGVAVIWFNKKSKA